MPDAAEPEGELNIRISQPVPRGAQEDMRRLMVTMIATDEQSYGLTAAWFLAAFEGYMVDDGGRCLPIPNWVAGVDELRILHGGRFPLYALQEHRDLRRAIKAQDLPTRRLMFYEHTTDVIREALPPARDGHNALLCRSPAQAGGCLEQRRE